MSNDELAEGILHLFQRSVSHGVNKICLQNDGDIQPILLPCGINTQRARKALQQHEG